MPVISDDQAKTIAGGITAIGGVQNYGGGGGQYNSYADENAPPALSLATHNSQNLLAKIGSIAKQAGGIALSGIKAGATYVEHAPVNLYHGVQPFLQGIASAVTGEYTHDLNNISKQREQLDKNQQMYMAAYKSGKMGKDQYVRLMNELGDSYSELSKGSQKIASQANRGNVVEGALNTAIDIASGGSLQLEGNSAQLAARASLASRATEGTTSALVRGVASPASKKELQTLIESQSTKLEKAIQNVPGIRSLVLRNTQSLAKLGIKQMAGEDEAQFVARNIKTLAVGLLIKQPLFYQLNIGSAKHVYQDMTTGKYGDAILTAGLQGLQLLEGPISAAATFLKATGKKLGAMTYGTGSFIDEVSKLTGNDIAGDLLKLKQTDPEQYAKSEKIWRIFQEMNLRSTNNDAIQAAKNFLENHVIAGEDLSKLSREILEAEATKHYDAQQVLKTLISRELPGIDGEKLKNAVVARFDRFSKQKAANLVLEAGNDKKAITDALFNADATANEAWNHNDSLKAYFMRAVDNGESAQDIANKIKAIPTVAGRVQGIPAKVQKQLEDLGYVLGTPTGGLRKTQYVDYEDTRKLISALNAGDEQAAEVFDIATAPKPALATLAAALTKAGMSPKAANQQAFEALSNNVADALNQSDVATDLGFVGRTDKAGNQMLGGAVILSKLQKVVNDKQAIAWTQVPLFGKARPAITDIRQLTNKEIRDGLKITSKQAREVKKAITQGYLNTPLEFRGLGDKIVDLSYRVNPLQGAYSRIQSALRYSYNPFFQTQEGFETAVFSGAQGGNRVTNLVDHHGLWNKSREELDATVSQLEQNNVFHSRGSAQGLFTSSLAGEAAQDLVIGRLTADITRAQKRDLAGLALDIAKSQGTTVQRLLDENPQQIEDALRVVVQYQRKGFLASPLARTMNLAFFPMRYNIKVTALAGKILAKAPPSVQFATVHSLLNLKTWLQSDEGIRWRQQNADAIQVFNWISPLGNINQFFNTLGYIGDRVEGKQDSGLGAAGMLGGLPFGVISQVLDSMGIISINAPYIEPKTGDVLPDYIPATTKAKAATALTDLLGSVFTYPGATLGLPGKQAMLRDAVKRFIATNGSDFTVRQYMDKNGNLTTLGEQSLTPMQKNMIRVLQGDTSSEAVNALYNSPAPGTYQGYTLPPSTLPFTIPEPQQRLSKTELAAATKKSKAKSKTTAKPVGVM